MDGNFEIKNLSDQDLISLLEQVMSEIHRRWINKEGENKSNHTPNAEANGGASWQTA